MGYGGTEIWCPGCRGVHACKGVSPAAISGNPDDRDQAQYFEDHPDIMFFQRGRICLSCGHEFVSAEVDIDFLLELMELRSALGDIKTNAERYTKEASAAGESLAALARSLGVLKALAIYKATNTQGQAK